MITVKAIRKPIHYDKIKFPQHQLHFDNITFNFHQIRGLPREGLISKKNKNYKNETFPILSIPSLPS